MSKGWFPFRAFCKDRYDRRVKTEVLHTDWCDNQLWWLKSCYVSIWLQCPLKLSSAMAAVMWKAALSRGSYPFWCFRAIKTVDNQLIRVSQGNNVESYLHGRFAVFALWIVTWFTFVILVPLTIFRCSDACLLNRNISGIKKWLISLN